jgi:hypothetical protein
VGYFLSRFAQIGRSSAHDHPPVNKQRAAELREILAAQRDQHARQRELVRASLAWCPGKTRPVQPR